MVRIKSNSFSVRLSIAAVDVNDLLYGIARMNGHYESPLKKFKIQGICKSFVRKGRKIYFDRNEAGEKEPPFFCGNRKNLSLIYTAGQLEYLDNDMEFYRNREKKLIPVENLEVLDDLKAKTIKNFIGISEEKILEIVEKLEKKDLNKDDKSSMASKIGFFASYPDKLKDIAIRNGYYYNSTDTKHVALREE